MTEKQQLNNNIEALKIALNWDGNSEISDEDYQVLSRFTGWRSVVGKSV